MNCKLTLVILLALTFLFIPLHNSKAEGERRYHHAISADPVTDLLGYGYGFFATYEQQLNSKNSFTIFGHYEYWGWWNHFGLGGSYRWYIKIKKDPLEGLSFGPFIFFEYILNNQPGYTQVGKGFLPSVGGEAAYKFIFNQFVVEPIFRLNIGFIKPENYGYDRFVTIGCNLGYAW